MADGPVVAVRGEAYREVAPELARFEVTATARERDRQVALTRLAERAAAVRVLLDEHEPAVDRREAGELRVRPETNRSGERVVGYLGSVSTTVTVTDFGSLAELMLRLAELDQVEVAGPWWSLRPDSPVHRDARHAAITDALRRPGVRRGARCPGDRAGGAGRHRRGLRRGRGDVRPPGPDGRLAGAGTRPRPQPVHAVVRARFTISEPDLA